MDIGGEKILPTIDSDAHRSSPSAPLSGAEPSFFYPRESGIEANF